jgi:hypothetical protein
LQIFSANKRMLLKRQALAPEGVTNARRVFKLLAAAIADGTGTMRVYVAGWSFADTRDNRKQSTAIA